MKKVYSDTWIDVKEIHDANPEFHCPSEYELDHIKYGDFVKICNGHERFWVSVTSVYKRALHGKVVNFLMHLNKEETSYNLGDIVKFRKCNVYEIDKTMKDSDLYRYNNYFNTNEQMEEVIKNNQKVHTVMENEHTSRQDVEVNKVSTTCLDMIRRFVREDRNAFTKEEFDLFYESIELWSKNRIELSDVEIDLAECVFEFVQKSSETNVYELNDEEKSRVMEKMRKVVDAADSKVSASSYTSVVEYIIFDKIENGIELTEKERDIYYAMMYKDLKEGEHTHIEELYEMMKEECIANKARNSSEILTGEELKIYTNYVTKQEKNAMDKE